MNVVNLEIQNKVITCKFGILAFKHYCDDQKIGLADLGDNLAKRDLFGMGDLIYFAYVANCNLNGHPVEFTKAQATEWLEYLDEKQLEEVNKAILDVKIFGKNMNAKESNDKKK